MCDTFVALRGWTREGATIFAKNSDRDPNEAQVLEFHPRSRRTEERVKCTYVSVARALDDRDPLRESALGLRHGHLHAVHQRVQA
ncbi:MAG: hypothetical protein LM580_04260, partial [Thermofilum sp.]|nr:hypothetical protein [Thermofilum sp.]